MTLAHRHAAAAARQRRIIFQDDILANAAFRCGEVGTSRLDRLIDFYMSRLEAPNQIDSVWHEWGEGNTAVWPSEVLPRTENVFPAGGRRASTRSRRFSTRPGNAGARSSSPTGSTAPTTTTSSIPRTPSKAPPR